MKKYLSLLMVAVLALALTACGGSSGSNDGQNPVMNYVGFYVCDRATAYIGAADDEDGAEVTVSWGSSASETSTWEMSGTFDAETKQFEYHDCVRTDFVYKEDGSIDSKTEVYTGGHGFMTFEDGDDGSTMTWQEDQEHVADGMVFKFAPVPVQNEPLPGAANPWKDADSLDAAAEGAGLDGFSIAEVTVLSIGEVKPESFRYMDGLAEVKMPVGAVEMTIRKGRADVATDGDISGDYNEYAHTWTQNIKGLEVTCFGNRDGEATKTIWQVDDICFAILAYGAGGDDDFGLNPDDINSLINGIQ